MALIIGIDEAGRGPVIGPMVIAGVVIKEEDEHKLIDIKVKDSKQLSALQREKLFDKIKQIAYDYKIIVIGSDEIDDALLSDDLNLNWLEAEKSVELINALKPEKAIVDSPSNNIRQYMEYIKKRMQNKKCKLTAEHKADEKYPVVSAASILAKVTRDAEIEKIKKNIGINFGSGYPSDPQTKSFMEKYFEKFKHIFRKTWAPYRQAVKKKNQKRLGEF